MHIGNRLAAVDLGSNSFRLEIGRIEHGSFIRTEYLKETVRQGGGLDEERNLTPEAMQNGWDCLARFGERLAGFKPAEVRAVATQTLREARNRDVFLSQANTILGFPINVISGREEARLIYQGVAQMLPQSNERRIVIDVGGRSTEMILGTGAVPQVMESFRVGSIAWSNRYFPDGQFTKKSFAMAEIAAKAVMDEALDAYHPSRWDVAYGSAGTVGAIADVLVAAGWPAGIVNQEGLDWLLDKLLAAQSADRLKIAGMREDRKAIIGGGVSIMRAIFDLLSIQSVEQAAGGLRHGLICDLLGATANNDDLRIKTVQRLASKFGVDSPHGARVGQVATTLFTQLVASSSNGLVVDAERHLRKLKWAAQLHEIGCHISHSDYHKHGAYILDNADAMGFSLSEMHRLSLLVLGHRGKLRKLEAVLGEDDLVLQLQALRLAVILCHARREPDLGGMTLQRTAPGSQVLQLRCRGGWAEAFPQSAYLLREEVQVWQRTPWSLEILGC
ncbi:exopolyphosphatase [Candidatus Aalborgicola defluviihabitans]|uniref:Ppx/GppA phosphatase family protein n=1 Tax=Candidatus Aalborgicola defluviihabitans TaxID=3386187 RepID=UPI001DEE0107|nr:Ppx/GppA family phosphatase [Burkholderiales bacterium]MBK7313374.1 Ppx/GppA family phosphatase [Burkholderiales bacterium]